MDNIKGTVLEVLQSIFPITLIMIVLQFTIIRLPMETFLQFLIGAVMVALGLILFLLGVNIGLSRVGSEIGAILPKTGKIGLILFFGFVLGLLVTIAEPDVRVLSTQVDLVSGGSIPKSILILSIGMGVGFYVALAMLRIIFNWNLVLLYAIGYGMVFLLAAFAPPNFVPIAFDSGGVTTGPLTVPFILALGLGIVSVFKGRSASNDGFGIVGLASLGPIMSVLLLGVIYG